MMRASVAVGFAAGALLCAAGPARAASPFDGAYKGDFRLGGGAGQCPPGGPFTLKVTDGRFDWGGGPDRTVVAIAADGSFSGQSGRRFLQGKAEGGRITAQVTGTACNYSWTMAR